MGTTPERVQELERDVRAGLAREVIADLDVRRLLGIVSPLSIHGLGSLSVNFNPSDSATISIDRLEIS